MYKQTKKEILSTLYLMFHYTNELLKNKINKDQKAVQSFVVYGQSGIVKYLHSGRINAFSKSYNENTLKDWEILAAQMVREKVISIDWKTKFTN